MKNLFLTLALMCSVSFAFANDGDKKENPEKKETIEQKVISNAVASLRIECFGLSCTTVCWEIRGKISGDGYANLWEFMDRLYC